MKKILLVSIALASLSFVNVMAQTADDEYKALTKEYMQLSNTDATLKTLLPQMFSSIKAMAPDVPSSVWESLEIKFTKKFSIEGCVSDMAEIYAKYLSKDDMRQIVAFYKTDAGKKLADNTPAISKDCYQWGTQLGMKIFTEIADELKIKGYNINM